MKRTIFILTALLAASALAQDLSTEITVERDIELALPKASPLPGVFPAMPQLPGTHPDIRPVQYSRAADFDGTAAPDSLALHNGTEAPDSRRGYLWAGYFPIYNLAAAAGYRIVDTQDSHLDAAASFNGYSYDTPLPQIGKKSISDNTARLLLAASHRLDNGLLLSAQTNYMHAALKSPTPWPRMQKQRINTLNIGLGIEKHGYISYAANLSYHTFRLGNNQVASSNAGFMSGADPAEYRYHDLEKASDDRLTANANISIPLASDKKQLLNIDASFDLLHRHGWITRRWSPDAAPHDISPLFISDITPSPWLWSLTPSYDLSFDNFKMHLGARFDIAHNTDGPSFRIAPAVEATWLPATAFSAFITADGGEKFFTLSDQYNYSPFLPGHRASSSVSMPVDIKLGINLRPVPALALSVYGRYASIKRYPMILTMPTHSLYLEDINMAGFDLNARISYTYRNILTLDAGAQTFFSANTAASPEALDRTRHTIDVSLACRPIDKLNLSLTYNLRACRSYLQCQQDQVGVTGRMYKYVKQNLGNKNDLSIGATYSIYDNFDVFVNLENLLAHRYQFLPNLCAQRLHGLAGVSLRF